MTDMMKDLIVLKDDRMTINPEILSMKKNSLLIMITVTWKSRILLNLRDKEVNMFKNQVILEK
jgi:hypothetical protein